MYEHPLNDESCSINLFPFIFGGGKRFKTPEKGTKNNNTVLFHFPSLLLSRKTMKAKK